MGNVEKCWCNAEICLNKHLLLNDYMWLATMRKQDKDLFKEFLIFV